MPSEPTAAPGTSAAHELRPDVGRGLYRTGYPVVADDPFALPGAGWEPEPRAAGERETWKPAARALPDQDGNTVADRLWAIATICAIAILAIDAAALIAISVSFWGVVL